MDQAIVAPVAAPAFAGGGTAGTATTNSAQLLPRYCTFQF